MDDNNQAKADVDRLIRKLPKSKLHYDLAKDRKLLQTAFENIKLWTEGLPNTTREIRADEDLFEIILNLGGQIKYQIEGHLNFSSPYRPIINYGPYPHRHANRCMHQLQGINGELGYICNGFSTSGPLTEGIFLSHLKNWLAQVNNDTYSF